MLGTAFLGVGLLLVAYPFLGYPAVLSALSVFGRRRGGRNAGSDGAWRPSLSLTVPVFNEAHQIRDLIESLLALDYPRDRLQILIVSDGSTDGTDDIVAEYAGRGVELLRVRERGGKGAAENAARAHLRGEIVVNTDASVRLHPGALQHLVKPYADPSVGVVSGRDVSVSRRAADANTGEGGYVGWEMWTRDLETRLGGIVGSSGCLYATRRELHQAYVPPELSRDFASALIARERGYAAVSAPAALCYVPRTASLRREYRRKVRTAARGMATLWRWRHLMNPLRHGLFAWKLASHKLCRWLIPVAFVLILAGLLLLAGDQGWARAAILAAGGGAGLGALGWVLARDDRALPRLLALPAYFVMSNVAVLHAWARFVSRGSEGVWEPTRREKAAEG